MGRLFDFGYFWSIILPASALIIFATFLIPECKEYWQFLLCQGLAIGVRLAFQNWELLNERCSIASLWRDLWACHCRTVNVVQKETRLGFGTICRWVFDWRDCYSHRYEKLDSKSGARVPILFRSMWTEIDASKFLLRFTWTVRIVGFILLAVLTLASLVSYFSSSLPILLSIVKTLKRRTPPAPNSEGIFNLKIFNQFKSPAFTIYCISAFFIYLGFYTRECPIVSEPFGAHLISILIVPPG